MRKTIGIRLVLFLATMGLALSVWFGRIWMLHAVGPGLSVGTDYKVVRCGPQTRMDAVVITRVTVAGNEVQCGLRLGPNNRHPVTPFQAGSDWVGEIDIYLLNRTNKSISWIDLALGFPETGNGRTEPQRIYHINLGRVPDVDAFSHQTGKRLSIDPRLKSAAFAPGQILIVHLSAYINEVRSYVENDMLLTQVTKVDIHRGTFYFDDGMRWQAGGGFSVPDPRRPGWFRQMDPGRFFPGHPSRNWPLS